LATKYWIASTASAFTTNTNWSDNVAPAAGDTLIFNHLGTGDVTSGLASGIGSGAGGESLTLIFEQGYTGNFGAVSAAGAATYLTFAATLETLNVYIGQRNGQGSATGSPRILIDSTNVTTATAFIFDSAASGAETYYTPIMLKGTWAAVHQSGGSWSLAGRTGETGTLTAGTITTEGDPAVAPNLVLGAGATLTRLDASSGTILNHSSNTDATVNLDGTADMTFDGISTACTTLSVDGDAVYTDKGTGARTITTLNVSGTYRRRHTSALTVSTLNLYPGATFDKNNGKAGTTTVSAKNLVRCGLQDVEILGPVGEFI
jgi:hypothetical protein